MNYYVLLYDQDINDGAFLVENSESKDFKSFEYFQCKSLMQYFDEPVEMNMSKDDPERRELYDLVLNQGKLLVISDKFRALLESEKCGEIEFLPVAIMDQRDKKVNQIYHVANLMESIDYIDEEKSEIDYSSINSEMINDITKLVINFKNVPKDRSLFRNKKKGNTYIVNESLKRKIEEKKLEGIKFVSVDEFDSELDD